MKAVVDSNIFLDYYLDRKDSMLPLGEFAFRFFKEAIECKYLILVCETNIAELGRVLRKKQNDLWKTVFSDLAEANKIRLIKYSEKQLAEAKEISCTKGIPLNDCLFAVLARDNKAILISRDKHLNLLPDLADVRKPEELP